MADGIYYYSLHLLQAVYHNIKPASLQQQLEAVHMSSDKAEIFSQAWATNGPELVDRLKQNIFTPKKVNHQYLSRSFLCINHYLILIYPHNKMQFISRTSRVAYTPFQELLLLFA